jgi:FecR protein
MGRLRLIRKVFLTISSSCLVISRLLWAEPFEDGKGVRITRVVGSVIRSKATFETGANSRVELRFGDSTTVRLGSNGKFRFVPGSREVVLDGGTMLVYLPRDVGGVVVQAGPVMVSAKQGDFEVSNVGGKAKVIALNGKISVRLRSNLNKDAHITAGKMIEVDGGATTVPKANRINLNELLNSSKLYLMGPWPGSAGVEANAAKQGAAPAISVPLGDATQTAGTVNQQIVQQQQALEARQALKAQQDAQAAQHAAQVAAERQQAARVAFAAQQQQARKVESQTAAQAQPTQPAQSNQGNAFGQSKPKNIPPGQAKKL